MRPTFLVLVALCIVKHNKAQRCLDDQLPSFSSGNSENHNSFNGGELILSPSLSFTCTGRVTRWQAYMEKRGSYDSIIFLVLRPTLWPCSYDVVGRHSLTNTFVDGSLVDTLVTSPIAVQPGDVIGVYSSQSNLRNTFKSYQNYAGISYRVQNVIDTANIVSVSCNSTIQTNVVPFVNAVIEITSQPPPVTMPLTVTIPLPMTTPPTTTTPPTLTTPSMSTTPQPVTTPPQPVTVPSPPVTFVTTSATTFFVQTSSTIARTMPPAQQHVETSMGTIMEDTSSNIPVNATSRQEQIRVSSNESNQNQAQDQTTSGRLYVVIGALAAGVAVFVILSLICGVVFCVFVNKRRSNKAMMRFTTQNSRHGRGKYYEGGHLELQLPDKFGYNDDHIYDTVDQFQAAPPSKKGKNSKKNQYLDTSFNNPNMLTTPMSSMEFSKRTTLGDRSKVGRNIYKPAQPFKQTAKSNDYEEHPSLPAAAVPQIMCSEYEVPTCSSQELQQSPKRAAGDEYCTPLRPKSNSKKSSTCEMRPSASFNPLSTENYYELPHNSANLTESQGKIAQTKATQSESHYDIPCTPQVNQQANTTQKKEEDDDEDYMSMDGMNS